MKKTIICLEMPNTLGLFLRRAIQKAYKPEETFNLRLVEKPNIELFENLSDDEKKNIMFLKGDVAFGIHEKLPQKISYFSDYIVCLIRKIWKDMGISATMIKNYLNCLSVF